MGTHNAKHTQAESTSAILIIDTVITKLRRLVVCFSNVYSAGGNYGGPDLKILTEPVSQTHKFIWKEGSLVSKGSAPKLLFLNLGRVKLTASAECKGNFKPRRPEGVFWNCMVCIGIWFQEKKSIKVEYDWTSAFWTKTFVAFMGYGLHF